MTNDAKYHKPIAEYLQSAWKELGINTDIKIVEWSTFTPTRRNGDFEIARNGWVYDYDDPSNMINLLETNNGNNDGKYSNCLLYTSEPRCNERERRILEGRHAPPEKE